MVAAGLILNSLKDTWTREPLPPLGVLFVVGTTLILLFPILPLRSPYDLQVGDVAPEDIHAPRQMLLDLPVAGDGL